MSFDKETCPRLFVIYKSELKLIKRVIKELQRLTEEQCKKLKEEDPTLEQSLNYNLAYPFLHKLLYKGCIHTFYAYLAKKAIKHCNVELPVVLDDLEMHVITGIRQSYTGSLYRYNLSLLGGKWATRSPLSQMFIQKPTILLDLPNGELVYFMKRYSDFIYDNKGLIEYIEWYKKKYCSNDNWVNQSISKHGMSFD